MSLLESCAQEGFEDIEDEELADAPAAAPEPQTTAAAAAPSEAAVKGADQAEAGTSPAAAKDESQDQKSSAAKVWYRLVRLSNSWVPPIMCRACSHACAQPHGPLLLLSTE